MTKKEVTYTAINWSLTVIVVLILALFGYVIADNRVQSQEIVDHANRIAKLESKPAIDYSKQIATLTKQINLLNTKQASVESKLEMIIDLATETNQKIDQHMSNSIPRPVSE